MIIEQIVYPIETLGPGKRIGIWMVGCTRHCIGCSNPELWSQEGWPSIDVESVVIMVESILHNHMVDGITISGGEPMDQAEELSLLVERLSRYTEDILVYTGYTYEELCRDPQREQVLNSIAVLVDGDYIEGRNTKLVLRGSSNQHIYLFRRCFEEKYQNYLSHTEPMSVQNMFCDENAVSFGIHEPGFIDDLSKRLLMKGVLRKNE